MAHKAGKGRFAELLHLFRAATTATARREAAAGAGAGSARRWTSRALERAHPAAWSSSWAATSPESACTSDRARRRSPAATRRGGDVKDHIFLRARKVQPRSVEGQSCSPTS